MKKFLLFLLILLLFFGGYILYDNLFNNGIPRLETEEEVIDISELYIYGTNLNLTGSLVSDTNLDLVLYNGEFASFQINITDNTFNLSNYINQGINLERIPVGKYYAFLRSSSKDEKDKDVYRYYTLNNMTEYPETVYYTFSNVGNKVTIKSDDDYKTLMFDVSKNTDNDIYDVVIDPGHGGMDSGAMKNGKKEAEYTMKIANLVKDNLEKSGVKVKLTREENQLSNNEVLPDYGVHGRAVIGHEVKAKYVFSIHLNSNGSSYVNGFEIYTAANINYDFAKKLSKAIFKDTNANYSTNKINKMFDGIYTKTFTEADIESSKKENEAKGRKAYDVTTKANYYFMIRETGGIMTGAYVDNRNEPKVLENPFYNSNIGSEAYLLELGYLTNASDIQNIDNNMDKYAKAISDTFLSIYNISEEKDVN